MSKDISYFAVFDGHGFAGLEASNLANQSITNYLIENSAKLSTLTDPKDMTKFMTTMCLKVQSIFKETKNCDYTLSGTCAVMVLIINTMCWVANLGDSRAVIGNTDKDGTTSALEISIDHKPFRKEENERIVKAGGKIEKSLVDDREVGPLRVWKADEDVPGIAITRSLGDLIAHKIGVIAEPEVTWKELDNDDKFIVIGSDGVWDVMSSAEAVGFILQCGSMEEAAKKMVAECRERWDLLNEIKRKQTQIYLDAQESDKKKQQEKMNQLEKNIVCDDITVVVAFLQALE